MVDILSFIRERSGDYDCPVCRDPLVACDLKLLRQDGNTYTVQVACAHCHVSFVVVLQLRGELPAAPAQHVEPAAPPISADEMLDLHEMLRDHDGTLAELFGRRGPSRV